jgi:flagellar hook-associated protein 3 FlgL
MRISNHMMAGNVLRNIGKQTERMAKLQEEISTRKVINRASDDPTGMAQVLSYRKTIASLEQYTETIADAKMHIKTMESILQSAGDLIEQAKDFVSGSESNLHETFAQQISDLREQLLGLANSKSNGSYLFAGEKTDTRPFDISGMYSGNTGDKEYLIGDNGVRISVAADGGSIFGASPNSVFNTLADLQAAFASGDTAAVQSQLEPLTDAIENLEHVRSVNAGRYKLLEATENRYHNFKTQMQNSLSSVEDVDPTQSIVELKSLQTSYESTLAVSARIIQTSLIDFLS